MTELIEFHSSDGLRLNALISPAAKAEIALIYIHGFGGDFYSSPLVHHLHQSLPSLGYTYVSIQTRVSHYIAEVFDDVDVKYVGSSIEDAQDVELDVLGILDSPPLRGHEKFVLIGHSFGSNVARWFARAHPERVNGVIALSPSDSEHLYDEWSRRNGASTSNEPETPCELDEIRWSEFGVFTDNRDYPIPIMGRTLSRLLRSPVFREWSSAEGARNWSHPTLIIQGAEDSISRSGATTDFRSQATTDLSFVLISNTGHGFNGSESAVSKAVAGWLNVSLK